MIKYDFQAIYVFYEKNGIVSDDVIYYLTELKKIIKNILVVVNGKISPLGRSCLEKLEIEILVRHNEGLDFGAWKAGINEISWEKLKICDGLLLCNCSCFGPIFPFKEIFDEMLSRDCDFWGINRHPEIDQYLVKNDPRSKVIEHIQSYFMFFAPRVIRSKHFKKWWDDLVEYSVYEQEVGYHETKFTKYLEDAGYKSSTYMNFDKYKKLLLQNASIQCCDIQLIEDRCPLVKKRIFNMDYLSYFYISSGQQVSRLMNYISNYTSYNIDYIWSWIIKYNKLSTIKRNLHLNYILPTKIHNTNYLSNSTVALILYIYYDDLVDYCFRYASSMPDNADIFIIVSSESVKKSCINKFNALKHNSVKYIVIQNRGRDVAAYLLGARNVFSSYDYVCCMHDKKSPSYGSGITGFSFSEHCFQSNLATSSYVKNILETFDKNPRLGMLVPPILDFGGFSVILGNETSSDRKNILYLRKLLNISVPDDEESVIPFGTMFWVRGKSFSIMFNHNWNYFDFPEEPCPSGGTLLHAIERVYPLAVQEAGYYVGTVMPDSYASVFVDNQIFMLRSLNVKIFNTFGMRSFVDICYSLSFGNESYKTKSVKYLMRFYKFKVFLYRFLIFFSFGKFRKKFKTRKNFYKKQYNFIKGRNL